MLIVRTSRFQVRVGILSKGQGTAVSSCQQVSLRMNLVMSKSLEIVTEVIRSTKHPFRQVDDRPDKAHKNRYERRKVKEYIKTSDWEGQSG